MEIIGYADRLSVATEGTVAFKVSTKHPRFSADLVRFTRALPTLDPDNDLVVPASFAGTYPGRVQAIGIGSFIGVDQWPALRLEDGLTVQLWLMPSQVPAPDEQGIVSCPLTAVHAGFWLGLDREGHVSFRIVDQNGGEQVIASHTTLIASRWYCVAAWIGEADCQLGIELIELNRGWLSGTSEIAIGTGSPVSAETATQLLIAASSVEEIGAGRKAPRGVFNGKIDRPRVWASTLTADDRSRLSAGEDPLKIGERLQAAWDFSQRVSGEHIIDTSTYERHGRTVNGPMRGVTGANWSSIEVAYHLRPHEYGAIAFHEDDLTDCGWETNFTFTVPVDPPTGVYAARLRADDQLFYVPFVVHPRVGAPSEPVLVLLPTYTYLAYANE